MSEKFDSFQPRRATSIDGFLSGSGQRPRNPQYRQVPVQQPKQGIASAPSQGRAVGLPDMPRRSVPTPVLTEAQVSPERTEYALDGSKPRQQQEELSRRQRRKARKAEKKAAKKAAPKKAAKAEEPATEAAE